MTDPRPNNHPPQSQSYAPAILPPRIERPVAVSLLAFLGIVLGALLFFCNTIAMVGDAMMLKNPERSRGPGMTPQDPLVMKWGAANAMAIAILAAILLGACLAAISLRRPARKIILLWSIAFILCGVGRTIGEINYVGPANIAYFEKNKPDDPAYASGRMDAVLVPKAIGVLVLYCILPLLFLTFWTRKDVESAFEHGGIPPA